MIEEGGPLWALYRWLFPRRRSYCNTFNTPAGKGVLVDLAKFCHANAPTTTERQAGRRDVWLHLQRFLRLDEEELAVMFAGLTPEQRHQIYKPSTTYIEEP